MRRAVLPVAVLLLAGCGSGPSGPQDVLVEVGPQEVQVPPSQECIDGELQRFSARPPLVEVSPDTTVRLTVPDSVAERGWGVQVYDDQLQEQLGTVDVDAGQAVLAEINTSDVVPATFYLVVVEDTGEACEGVGGAWPVGFLRAGGDLTG
ncbi:DUF2771 family protein [Geodermatophilus sp. DSM 44513]|uniref:DUF2771 family protein n=1 Tax=Geodermatophilus sp. DSM 44513 TaxID=1528104 RepID=UPI001284A387|nr:DUF2771 family protein [Geodermatophilus sp. DSM 44513]WNV76312.1 DUF2771 family protein [Geodermatophilus sp. DSM 44513]